MKMRGMGLNGRLAAAIVFCTAVALSGQLKTQGPPGAGAPAQPDLLIPLKQALKEAGVSALTAVQEQRINALVNEYRTGNRIGPPSAAVQAALRAHESAMLAGDAFAAAAQIPVLANDQAGQATVRMQAEATYTSGVMQALGPNGDQVSLLQKRFGSSGVLRLIQALVGPGGPGGPGPGPGPGSGPPPLPVAPVKK